MCTSLASTMNSIIIANLPPHLKVQVKLTQQPAVPLSWGYLVTSIATHALSLCVMMSQVDTLAKQQLLCMCHHHVLFNNFKYIALHVPSFFISLVLCWCNFIIMGVIINHTMSIAISCMTTYFGALDRKRNTHKKTKKQGT